MSLQHPPRVNGDIEGTVGGSGLLFNGSAGGRPAMFDKIMNGTNSKPDPLTSTGQR